MWIRLVIIAMLAAAVFGCNPFEGTIFEFRASPDSVEQKDPNTARQLEKNEPTLTKHALDHRQIEFAGLMGDKPTQRL